MKRVLSLALSGALAVASIGCYSDPDTNTQIGAAAGGLIGAGLGAVIGSQTGDPGAGVAIGSVAGALAGGAVGNQIDAQEKRYASNEERLHRQDRELGSTRREIEGLRRSQDDSPGYSRDGDAAMRARPGRIVAKEDMSTSTRMRLAQMAAEGKVVDPFAGKNGSVGELEGEDPALKDQARAGLKLSKKGKTALASKAVLDRKSPVGKGESSKAGKLGKKVKGASDRKLQENTSGGMSRETSQEMSQETQQETPQEMLTDVPEAGANEGDSFLAARAPSEMETEEANGLVRPSSIFSPLTPSAARTGGKGGANDSFRRDGDSDSANKGREDFTVGKDSISDSQQAKSNVNKVAARGGVKAGSNPGLPAVSEETLGELLDKDHVEARGDSAGVAADEAAIVENARKIQNITSKGITESSLTGGSESGGSEYGGSEYGGTGAGAANGIMEEVDVAKGALNRAAGGLADAGAEAVQGGVHPDVTAKLAKSKADAASELARYGEESTLGDLSELEGDIDQLAKSGQAGNNGGNNDANNIDDQAGQSGQGSEGKLADKSGADNKSPCGQAAADLKEGMALSSHGDKLFHYRRAIRLCPTDPKYHNALGEFYLSLKRYDDAKHEFKEALAVDSGYRKSQQNLKELERAKAGA